MLKFRFAKTMPDEPHEYVMLTDENRDEFLVLVQKIQNHGEWGTWNGRHYRYFYADGFKYWHVGGTGINRTHIKNPALFYAGEIKRAAEEQQSRQKKKQPSDDTKRKRGAPPPEMTDEERATLLAALSRMTFAFAKTLWETPHQWVARLRNAEEDYVLLHDYWKKFGVWGEWISPEGQVKRYKYLYPGDGFRYWAMSSTLYPIESDWASKIINRARIENPEEYFAEDMKRAKEEMAAKAAKSKAK